MGKGSASKGKSLGSNPRPVNKRANKQNKEERKEMLKLQARDRTRNNQKPVLRYTRDFNGVCLFCRFLIGVVSYMLHDGLQAKPGFFCCGQDLLGWQKEAI